VIVNRTQQETPDDAILQQAEQQAIDIVIGAARRLV
ncbi:MAG: uridine phosphorylase, partial [Oceanisphaera sp.]|nr:uridine phosphorylase [Oceanisphaera sp.]